MDDYFVPISCFTQTEIMEMENLYDELGEETLGQEFCQDVATSFSRTSGCCGNMSVQWEQVQDWFRSRHKKFAAEVTSSPIVNRRIDTPPETPMLDDEAQNSIVIRGINTPPETPMSNDAPQTPMSNDAPQTSIVTRGTDTPPETPMSDDAPHNAIVPRGDRVVEDLSELTYEAKSSKDDAWYDVAAFLTYRVLSSGELEARVRFSGFGNEEDEWVNVKRGIRKRSIPLEPSECHRVTVGDLVLCFQERSDQAVYCDAHIIEIQRRLHDIKGCRCIFAVRYDHDNSEAKVSLKSICCRSTQY